MILFNTWTPTNRHTGFCRPAETYIHQLIVDTGYRLEDLSRARADWDRWRERKRMYGIGTDVLVFGDL